MTQELETLVKGATNREREEFQWLVKDEEGRAYCWNLLVRILGIEQTELALMQTQETRQPNTLQLEEQLALLTRYGFPINDGLYGHLLSYINHTGADDPNAPEPLRTWLRSRNTEAERTWGEAVAREYWPEHYDQRAAFCFTVSHLAVVKELVRCLVDRDTPRNLARAMVNYVVERKNYFKKAPERLQRLVLELDATPELQSTMASLRALTELKIGDEGRHAPIARLSNALEGQFRIWKTDNFPSRQRYAQVALGLASPWFTESLGTYDLANRLDDHLCRLHGGQHKLESSKRYVRAYANYWRKSSV